MAYKDQRYQTAIQRHKYHLYREMVDGFARKSVCVNCGITVYAFDPKRHSENYGRWLHFVDPKGLGLRPMGKNDPVYDFVRECHTALKHRYLPEGIFDPRQGAEDDLALLVNEKLATIPRKSVAEPREH